MQGGPCFYGEAEKRLRAISGNYNVYFLLPKGIGNVPPDFHPLCGSDAPGKDRNVNIAAPLGVIGAGTKEPNAGIGIRGLHRFGHGLLFNFAYPHKAPFPEGFGS
jgi:hypothetical protein